MSSGECHEGFIRKVISAIDTDGCSRFLEDTQVPVTLTDEKYPGFAVTELFSATGRKSAKFKR